MPSGWVGTGERPQRCHHLDHVTGRERVVQPVRHPAPRHAGGGDPQGPRALGRVAGQADRVRLPHLGALDGGAQGEVLAGLEPVVLTELVGDGEGDRHGVVGQALHGSHRERVELRAAASDGVGPGTGEQGHQRQHRLELVERLTAGQAPAQRLARGRPEPRELLGVGAAALRTRDQPALQRERHGPAVGRHRRRDPELAQPLTPALAHPVRRPRRAQHRADVAGVTRLAGGMPYAGLDDLHGRAAGVRRRDGHSHVTSLVVHGHVAQDAQVLDGDDRDLRVRDVRDRAAHVRQHRGPHRVRPHAVDGHQDAPGWDRAMCCSSARR